MVQEKRRKKGLRRLKKCIIICGGLCLFKFIQFLAGITSKCRDIFCYIHSTQFDVTSLLLSTILWPEIKNYKIDFVFGYDNIKCSYLSLYTLLLFWIWFFKYRLKVIFVYLIYLVKMQLSQTPNSTNYLRLCFNR